MVSRGDGDGVVTGDALDVSGMVVSSAAHYYDPSADPFHSDWVCRAAEQEEEGAHPFFSFDDGVC